MNAENRAGPAALPAAATAPPAADLIAAFRRALAMTTIDGRQAPTARAALRAAAQACRGELAERWVATQAKDAARGKDQRRVHYLSMEFLMGRALRNALAALKLEPALRDELSQRGVSLADVLESEPDAALGNGG
ncbi:MAG TPA: hypothetical protein DCM32_09170, partial [Xanthomonadaceae bacterium]|nr:hypothetical protein [Xanthomonadaceae bacterium]